ncbi:hypothetical protein HYT57_00595 [Candidatus Woesearchaeota archaeon]|nr:hypothetical protein [Candidatus Woesearchaeota archaeon]
MADLILVKEREFLDKIKIIDIINAVDYGFKLLGGNKAMQPERISFYKPSDKSEGYFNLIMPAILDDVPGMKFLIDMLPIGKTTGEKASVIIYPSMKNNKLILLEANKLTDLRTGAAAALIIKYLNINPRVIAISGAGRIGKAAIKCFKTLYPRAKIKVMDPSVEALNLIEEKADIVNNKKSLLKDTDVWFLAVPTSEPIINKEDLAYFKGRLIITMTGDPKVKLITKEALELLDIIVDNKEQCLKQGQLRINPKAKILGDIGEAALGKIKPKKIVLFDSTGLAVQDVALGKLASKYY